MKPYMSYWSGGYRKTPDQFVINLHKLCAFYLNKNFKEVHFITDSKSLPYFKDIRFTSISLDFDTLPMEYGDTWSLNKLFAYKLIAEKGDPFFHVDYDVVLWEGLEDIIKKADIFAQNREGNSYYWYELEKFKKNCPNLHLVRKINIQDADALEGINVGVIGGHDLEFLYNYSKSALDLILDPINRDFWLNYDGFNKTWIKAVISEQYYLAVCEKYYNKKIEMIFPDGWPSGVKAEHKYYTHFMGAKYQQELKDKVALMVYRLGL